MVVVSDTSCLSALLKVQHFYLLELIFGKIIVPPKVAEELGQLEKFGTDLSEFNQADWVSIQQPTDEQFLFDLLSQLDEGESEAIALAIELSADWLIIDEWKGRQVATSLSIHITGLAGVLLLAKQEGHLTEIKPLLDRIMTETSFRLSEKLIHHILQAAGE